MKKNKKEYTGFLVERGSVADDLFSIYQVNHKGQILNDLGHVTAQAGDKFTIGEYKFFLHEQIFQEKEGKQRRRVK